MTPVKKRHIIELLMVLCVLIGVEVISVMTKTINLSFMGNDTVLSFLMDIIRLMKNFKGKF